MCIGCHVTSDESELGSPCPMISMGRCENRIVSLSVLAGLLLALCAFCAPAGAAVPPGTLSFAGYPWTVKSSTSPVGPGPNVFAAAGTDETGGPFVDSSGLHLQVVHTNTGWESSEVILNPTLGYGTYRWTVSGPLSSLDPNVVFSLFTYDDSEAAPSNNREMDFEASRFGAAGDPTNAQYVVQPYDTAGNLQRISLPAADPTTITMTWLPGTVTFSSGSLGSWTNSSTSVPTSSTEQVHMSLWLFRGAPPSDGQPVSVAVTDFQFTASPPSATISSPADHQTYDVGQSVPTHFTCTVGANGRAITSCVDSDGSTSSGWLDTSMPGNYAYSVAATDGDGGTGATSIA